MPGRGGVRQVGFVDDVAPAQLQRVDPELAGDVSIICSRAVVSIIHGPRYEHRPHVFV